MRSVYFLVLSVLLSGYSFAQNVDSKTKSLGVFGDTNAMFSTNDNPTFNSVGVEYTKWLNKYIAYRVMLGYGNATNIPNLAFTDRISSDTITGTTTKSNISLGILGFGIEAERQFYKRLFFFAGFEIRAGYGNGSVDSTITTRYFGQNINPLTNTVYNEFYSVSNTRSGPMANAFYVAFTPSFGLKLEFRKFSFGTEFMNYCSYRAIHSRSTVFDDSFDFDFGNITQRFFVDYKL